MAEAAYAGAFGGPRPLSSIFSEFFVSCFQRGAHPNSPPVRGPKEPKSTKI
jgi:hypothetical protein